MANPFGAPEVTVEQVAQKVKNGEKFVWIDVREANEHARVSIDNPAVILLPLSDLASGGIDELPPEAQDKDAEIIINCHHGMRSAQAAAWLMQQGWTNVFSLDGGIDDWARRIDPSIGTY